VIKIPPLSVIEAIIEWLVFRTGVQMIALECSVFHSPSKSRDRYFNE
jgi:hypothetical protein